MRDFFEARRTHRLLLIAADSKNAHNMAELTIGEIGEDGKEHYDAFRMGENIASESPKEGSTRTHGISGKP
jgi:hypothetical protein